MIFQIAKEGNDWTANEFLNNWGRELAAQFQTLTFGQLAEVRCLPCGVFLFTDIEMATPPQRLLLAQVWGQLESHGGCRLLNHPLRTMGRYDLLRTLADAGVNAFRAFRIGELPSDLRFPVFLRIENDHWGSRSPLLENWTDLERWLVKAALGGSDPDQLLVTEFCDTKDRKGFYRKFSTFFLGGHIVPRHIHFSRNWMLKMADYADHETLDEERHFMDAVPNQDEIRRIFKIAHIEYGRIDYAFKDGRMQVWEINTNPTLTVPEAEYPPAVVPTQKRFAALMVEAFKRINPRATEDRVPVSLRFDVHDGP